MKVIKILVDECISHRTIPSIIKPSGIDLTLRHAKDFGLTGTKDKNDKDIVDFAIKNRFVVITRDTRKNSFLKFLHDSGENNPGLIWIREGNMSNLNYSLAIQVAVDYLALQEEGFIAWNQVQSDETGYRTGKYIHTIEYLDEQYCEIVK